MKNQEKTVKGYKVFNPNFTCNNYQYAEGQEFTHEGKIVICQSGFHFCEKAEDCFSYYSFDPQNIVCEVEGRGIILRHDSDSKICTDKIFIGKKLTWDEVLKVANSGSNNTGNSNSGNSNSGNSNSGYSNSGYSNSGNWNSGDRNSGNSNSGYRNSGNSNSGNWNSGDRNSGDSNSGYRNSGAFCLDDNPIIYIFDKPTKMKVREWEQSKAIRIMNSLLEIEIWIEESFMNDEEKENNPSYKTTGGYLKTKTLHEAWGDMWNNLSEDNKQVFLELPNFDADKFFSITGIRV